MQRTNERKEGYLQNRDNRREERNHGKEDTGPRNYRNPDPLNCGLEGKTVTVTLINGRSESGTLKAMGQFFMSMELANRKLLIIGKASIVTVSVL